MQTHAGGELRITTHQHANGHTKHKTFTPCKSHSSFILMLATCDQGRATYTTLTDTVQSRHTPGQPRV